MKSNTCKMFNIKASVSSVDEFLAGMVIIDR